MASKYKRKRKYNVIKLTARGNAKTGYEIIDQYNTQKSVRIESDSDEDIFKALIKAGMNPKIKHLLFIDRDTENHTDAFYISDHAERPRLKLERDYEDAMLEAQRIYNRE